MMMGLSGMKEGLVAAGAGVEVTMVVEEMTIGEQAGTKKDGGGKTQATLLLILFMK